MQNHGVQAKNCYIQFIIIDHNENFQSNSKGAFTQHTAAAMWLFITTTRQCNNALKAYHTPTLYSLNDKDIQTR